MATLVPARPRSASLHRIPSTLFASFTLLAVSGCAPAPSSDVASSSSVSSSAAQLSVLASDVRLNHIQMEGTHNSTHIPMPGPTLPEYHYTHQPLEVQFEEQGVRQIELDLHYNAQKDRIAVYHVMAIDFRSTCRMLRECFEQINAWSTANPLHHPIIIQFEMKTFSSPKPPLEMMAQLETDIKAVFPIDRVITPDEVQGTYRDLATAVASGNWPRIDDVRGHVMFAMEDDGEYRSAYTYGDQDLHGRLIFVDAPPGYAYSAYTILNDPIGDLDAIRSSLAAGLIVRTRADSCCTEADNNDFSRLEAALASGAHIITTDFPDPVDTTDYWVEMPGGNPSRCNPITALTGCTSTAIENLP